MTSLNITAKGINKPFIKLFTQFLLRFNIYDAFIYNSIRDSIKYNFNDDFQNPISNPYHFINSSFTWGETKEGSDFWEDMEIRWYLMIEDLIKKLDLSEDLIDKLENEE